MSFTPQECLEAFAEVFETLIPELDTIQRWFKILESGGSLLEPSVRAGRPPLTGVEEIILDLLQNDPKLSATKMAEILNITLPTVVYRLYNG
jgi:transposase